MDAMMRIFSEAMVGQAAHAAMLLAGMAACLLTGAWAAASVAVVAAGKRSRRREL